MTPNPLFQSRPLGALAVVVGMSAFLTGLPVVAQDRHRLPATADTETVTHVLNRIGFGARPGDVGRVKAMGVAAYIDLQLHPERIDNAALEAQLAGFETLRMSTQELSEKYFLPALQIRRDQQIREQRAAAQAE